MSDALNDFATHGHVRMRERLWRFRLQKTEGIVKGAAVNENVCFEYKESPRPILILSNEIAVSAIRIAEGTIEMSTLKFSADGVELFLWRDLSAARRNQKWYRHKNATEKSQGGDGNDPPSAD